MKATQNAFKIDIPACPNCGRSHTVFKDPGERPSGSVTVVGCDSNEPVPPEHYETTEIEPETGPETVRSLDPRVGRWNAVRITNRTGDRGNRSWETLRRIPSGASVGMRDLHEPDSIPETWHAPDLPTTETDPRFLYWKPDRASWASYSGTGPTERSNFRVFLRRHGDRDGVHRVHGGHNTNGVLIRGDVTAEPVLRDVRRLDASTIAGGTLDGTDRAELEETLRREALDGWALRQFWSAVENRALTEDPFAEHARRTDRHAGDTEETLCFFIDRFPETERKNLFRRCRERTGTGWTPEGPDSVYIDVERVASAVEPSDVLP